MYPDSEMPETQPTEPTSSANPQVADPAEGGNAEPADGTGDGAQGE